MAGALMDLLTRVFISQIFDRTTSFVRKYSRVDRGTLQWIYMSLDLDILAISSPFLDKRDLCTYLLTYLRTKYIIILRYCGPRNETSRTDISCTLYVPLSSLQ